jgi:hypothetical protein
MKGPDLDHQVADRVKLPRWMACFSMMENRTSTRFSQAPEVGVKWSTALRGKPRQVRTLAPRIAGAADLRGQRHDRTQGLPTSAGRHPNNQFSAPLVSDCAWESSVPERAWR